MIPTKTSKEIAIYLHDATGFIPLMFSKQDQPNELAKLENEKWVSVNVLQQKLGQERKKLVEIEKNTRPELWKEGARWCIKFIDELLVGLEPEEAKK